MSRQNIREPKLDYYGGKNADWNGRVLRSREETAIFPDNSYMRIWRNVEYEDYRPHWHNAFEIIIVMENYYDVEVGATHYHLLPGDILIIPSGESHSISAPESGSRFILLFGIGSISKIRGYSGMHAVIENCMYITPETTPSIYPEIYDSFISIITEYFNNSEFSEFSIYATLFRTLVTIARYQVNRSTLSDTDPKRRKHIHRFQDAIDYIDTHYTEAITLESVASHSGFSKYHFSRLFKEYTGSNFYDYLIARRIKASEQLLSQVNTPITEVALQSGFSSISTFNRIFKRIKNCTPGEYRLLCQDRTYAPEIYEQSV